MQNYPLWKRVAINVPALDVVRPPQAEWESLEAGNKWGYNFYSSHKSSQMKNLIKHYVTKSNAHFLTSRRIEAVTSGQADLSCREPMGLFKWRLHVSKQLIPLSLPTSQYLISEIASFH